MWEQYMKYETKCNTTCNKKFNTITQQELTTA
jgi:hypothetical protein